MPATKWGSFLLYWGHFGEGPGVWGEGPVLEPSIPDYNT